MAGTTRLLNMGIGGQPAGNFSGKTLAPISVTTTPSAQVVVLKPKNPGYGYHSLMLDKMMWSITETMTLTLYGNLKI